jgi:hypothetical protein
MACNNEALYIIQYIKCIVTDLLKALLGNGSVNTFQYTSHATVVVFFMLGSSQGANGRGG